MKLEIQARSTLSRMLILLALLTGIFSSSYAQDRVRIEGTVTNGQDALNGVSVRIADTNEGTATNENGRFVINAPKGSTIIFSYLGYKERSIPVNNPATVNIQLEPESGSLNEVVVVGYGTKRKVNLTGSVSTVSSREIEGRPITNLSSALQGTMAGVTVTKNTGQPGRDQATIRVRGIGTLSNSDAMVLVDGIVSSMDDVNPNDIESITVLKDAASASIYGSRAANGVILITTKSGKEGKLTAHYNGYVGKQSMTTTPDFLDSWQAATLYNEALVNEGKSPKYSDAQIQKFKDGSDPEHYPNTDWFDLFWRGDGIQQDHSLDVSGGSEKMQGYLSLDYFSQDGLVQGSKLDRYSTRFKTSAQITPRIKLSGNVAYSQEVFREPISNIHALDFGQLLGTLYQTGRVVPNKINGYWGYSDEGNPIAVLQGGSHNLNKSHHVSAVFQGDIELLKGLHLEPLFGYDANIIGRKSRVNDQQYYDPNTGAPTVWEGPNIVASSTSLSGDLTMQALLHYDKTFGDHSLSLMGGYSQEHYKGDYLFGSRRGYLNNALAELDAGPISGLQNSGNASEWALQSVFGRVDYSFRGKYLVEGNIRDDASSRFASENRWALFPSASVGWRISEEPFFDFAEKAISDLKIRASWGKLGNQNIGDYPYQATIATGQNYTFGGETVDGIAPTTGANVNIKWETTTTKDIGLDATLMNGKITFTGDYFIKNTTGILLSLPVLNTFGLTPPVVNAGSVQNKGFELAVGYHVRNEKFTFDATGNISSIQNKITDLAGTGPYRSGATIQAVGLPINSIYGWVSEGLFQSQSDIEKHASQDGMGGPVGPGDIKYKDLNGDGVIDANDREYLGSYYPKVTYGLHLSAQYRGFDATLFLQGAAGLKSFVSGRILGSLYDKDGDPTSIWWDRWTPTNTNATFPRVWNSYTQNDPSLTASSFWVRDAGYMRIKNAQIGYTLPDKILSRAGVKLRVYWTGQNILTLTKFYKWVDPEAPLGESGYTYPMVMVNSIGVNLTF